MLKDYVKGFLSYFQSFRIIAEHKLWGYVLIPMLLSLVVGSTIIYSAMKSADKIGDWLIGWYRWEWGSNYISTAADWLGGFLVIIIGFMLFKYIIMAVASPFMSLLSEKIETRLYGKADVKFTINKFISDLVRGLRIALRNITREIFFTIILLLIGLIPLFSIIIPVLIFLVQAYYAGFGNIDYTLERHLNVKGSVNFVRQNRWFALGNGTGFVLMLMTGVGFLFALPLGTAGATEEILDRLKTY